MLINASPVMPAHATNARMATISTMEAVSPASIVARSASTKSSASNVLMDMSWNYCQVAPPSATTISVSNAMIPAKRARSSPASAHPAQRITPSTSQNASITGQLISE